MKYDFLGVIVFGIVLLIGVAVIAAFITVGIFLIRALSRYVKSGNVRKEKSSIKKSLGEVLKQHREECKMTQEFVAESIGVSRQAVSKWETGAYDTMIASGILYALESEGYETNHATRIKDARSLIEFLELIGYLQKLQIMMHAGWNIQSAKNLSRRFRNW